jgi:hypothetical protein
MNTNPTWPNDASAKVTLIKCFGHLVPIYPGEEEHLAKDVATLVKAHKYEAKQWKKIELACTNPATFKKAARMCLASKRNLQAAMLFVNKRRLIRDRLSLRQIIEKSKEYNILTKLDEQVKVSRVEKSSGKFRPICNFGPVARGAQHMVLKLLRAATTPAPFQFTSLGVHKAIKEALRLITQEGYHEIAEIDIKSHYPSFEVQSLLAVLPLPASAVKQIVAAISAKYEGPHEALCLLYGNHLFHQTPLGMPQGSAASSAVAEWSVSHLKVTTFLDIAIVNFADNFFVFAKTAADLTSAVEALRSAIAGLPGGAFKTEVRQVATVQVGFRMLGCDVSLTPKGIDVYPADGAAAALRRQFGLELEGVEALLSTAKKAPHGSWRMEGVQAWLRLRNRIAAWVSAYSVCSGLDVFEEDLVWQLELVRSLFQIADDEMKAVTDPSVNVVFTPYGASGAE